MENKKRCKVVICYQDYEEAVYLPGDALEISARLDDLFGFFDDHDVILKPHGRAEGQEWRINIFTEID